MHFILAVISTSEFCQQKDSAMPIVIQQPLQRKSLAMCFTSTGATLSLPPKKKDIYRPYSLDDKPSFQQRNYGLRVPAEEDLHAAHGKFIETLHTPKNKQMTLQIDWIGSVLCE